MIGRCRLIKLWGEPLTVPLKEPFVIATARVDATRAVLVHAEVEDLDSGRRGVGVGEAAALPPVTHEDQPELLESLKRAAAALLERPIGPADAPLATLPLTLPDAPVARSGIEAAILDGWARARGVPLHRLLHDQSTPVPLMTDITLPIAESRRMAELAERYWAEGFRAFKVKVGKDRSQDLRALKAIHSVTPEATFRLDANEGFDANTALGLLDDLRSAGITVECFEQPCRRDDWDGMAEVTRQAGVPVVADESLRSLEDMERIIQGGAASAVNLKLSKLGGPLTALAAGAKARAAGLQIMAGQMVETRLGTATMAQVVTGLGGVDWVDLDTALLLDGDPFDGGYLMAGPRLELTPGAGHDVRLRAPC